MSDVNIFEQASRQKIRFNTWNGNLNTEDLWDLPLTSTAGKVNLDSIARDVNRAVKEQEEESFVTSPAKKNRTVLLAFEVVKAIIKVRLEENAAIATAVAKAKQKQVLVDALAAAQSNALGAKTPEEIQALIDAL